MADGRQWSLGEFAELHTRTAGAVEWTLDALLDGLKDRSESGHFDDDCTLVRLNFP